MEAVTDISCIKKELRRQRLRAYTASLFISLTFGELLWVIFNAIKRNSEFFFVLPLTLIFALIAIFSVRRIIGSEQASSGRTYDAPACDYLMSLSDVYIKQLINSIALFIGILFVFIGSEMSFYVFGNSKSAELVENIFSNILVIEIPIYLLAKNIILFRVIANRVKLPEPGRIRLHIKVLCIFSLAYWILTTLFTVIAADKIYYPANIFLISGIIFAIIILIYDLGARGQITGNNIVFEPLKVIPVAVIALSAIAFLFLQKETFYTQPYINSIPVVAHNTHNIDYDDATGIYTITMAADDFKILHLTDIHIGGSLYSYRKDMKALRACYAEIEHTHPDLVIVTGDLCFPLGIMSMSLNNSAPVHQFAAFMRNIGIPWAFTYGNHDTESLASLNRTELNEVYKSLSYKTSGTLLYPYVQPDITGRNNQLIRLQNPDGSLNTGLFLIDSNAYTGEGINVYDYIHDDQVDWYEAETLRMNEEAGYTVNSLCFFHIPLQEYRTATELYLAGSDEVKYYFGENPGDHGGITNDLVCCSDYPSRLFDTALKLGSTTGMFCGHDHYNNASIEYKGIRLTYGMSIDYLAMPGIERETGQRGAELITIHPDSTWDVRQIPLTSISGETPD